MKNFSDLGLSKSLNKVLPELGFEKPTPIQLQSIPLLLNEKQDFIGLAQTGTGKTAAFGLPLLQWINPKNKSTQALILAPTRELGQQIAQQLTTFSKYLSGVKIQSVYGGASIVVQMKDIKKHNPQIIIATPGRLLDLIRRKVINLSTVKFVVLDEADEMLNMGFKEDLDQILSFTGDEKNTWLFSATMPKDIRAIIKNYMTNPVEAKVSTGNQVNENIKHQYCLLKSSEKFEGLKRILDSEEQFRGVIFCRTRLKTQQLADELNKNGYLSEALHGDLSQAQRDRVMKRFKSHNLKVLIATDVAARGIDVNDLTHVIHYALPDDPSYYTHRSGRTARAGKKGVSISLLTNRDLRKLDILERSLKLKIEKINVPTVDSILSTRLNKWAQSIIDTPTNKKMRGEILTNIQMQLGQLTYEELVEKLVNKEIEALNYNNAPSISNTPSTRKKENRKSERTSTRDKRSTKKRVRFFMNIGKVDGVNKGDILDFITDTAKIRKSDIGNIDIQKNCSFIEIDNRHSKSFSNHFKGIFVDGRELRVNKDSK